MAWVSGRVAVGWPVATEAIGATLAKLTSRAVASDLVMVNLQSWCICGMQVD